MLSMTPNVFEIIVDFCRRLEKVGIQYAIGGSVASSLWGEPRATNDADFEIWLDVQNAKTFVGALEDSYNVYLPEVEEAIEAREEFPCVQALNFKEIFKFDCFIGDRSPISKEAYEKSRLVEILPGEPVRVAAPEYVIVQKLRWFRIGNFVNKTQWHDLISVASVTKDLDWSLIYRWANVFGLEELARDLKGEDEGRTQDDRGTAS